jgi:hypothetical protein
MIVRRTRLVGNQAELWPDWQALAHFPQRLRAVPPLA